MRPELISQVSAHLNDASRSMHAAWAISKGEVNEDGDFYRDAIERLHCVAHALGLELVRRHLPPPPPADVGPDDGLQMNERGDVVGR